MLVCSFLVEGSVESVEELHRVDVVAVRGVFREQRLVVVVTVVVVQLGPNSIEKNMARDLA